MTLRVLAVIFGVVLFGYPGYFLVSEAIAVARTVPLNAPLLLSMIVGLLVLYGGLLLGIAIQLRRQDIGGMRVFKAGVRTAVVLGAIGIFGPFVYAWLTNTEVGNLTPIIGVFAFLVGSVLAAGAGLITYGVAGKRERAEPTQEARS